MLKLEQISELSKQMGNKFLGHLEDIINSIWNLMVIVNHAESD
jgi:hypothetical protein